MSQQTRKPGVKRTAAGSSRSPSSGRRKTAAGRSRRGGRKASRSLSALVAELVVQTYFGRVLLTALLAALVIALDLLVSRNQYDLFFIILGIEMIFTAILLWLKMLLRHE
ncbi:MAG: hypothetical protein VB070_01830 [Clostridiaceae bacterium]|nr:hypothetical protein [Clostridiaceae bacterium]